MKCPVTFFSQSEIQYWVCFKAMTIKMLFGKNLGSFKVQKLFSSTTVLLRSWNLTNVQFFYIKWSSIAQWIQRFAFSNLASSTPNSDTRILFCSLFLQKAKFPLWCYCIQNTLKISIPCKALIWIGSFLYKVFTKILTKS